MYPKWKYHTTDKPKIVYNANEEDALGAEWEESPASFFDKIEAKIEHVAKEVKEVVKGKKKPEVVTPDVAVVAAVEPIIETPTPAGE